MSLAAGVSAGAMFCIPLAPAPFASIGCSPETSTARVSGDTIPFSIVATTASTCLSRGAEPIVSRAGSARMSTPGRRPAAAAMPKLIRFKIAPVFIHDSPVSGQPLGA